MTDPIRKAVYDEKLVDAASHWLIERFANDDLDVQMPDNLVGTDAPEGHPLLTAAMTIVNGDAWTQPLPHQSHHALVLDQTSAQRDSPRNGSAGDAIAVFHLDTQTSS